MVQKSALYYFSPTGGTRRVGSAFAAAAAQSVRELDLGVRDQTPEAPACDLAVFALPVFGGRIPAPAAKKLRSLHGSGTKAVTLVVYGNRAYDDALLELNHTVAAAGFEILASGAFIARHSIVPQVAAGRPDEADLKEIRDFAEKVLKKIAGGDSSTPAVPGNDPYKPEMQVAASPISLENCRHCGKCAAVCPTGAIRVSETEVVTELSNCILCMACTSVCPEKARVLPEALQSGMNQKLMPLKEIRRENEIFI